MCDTRDWVLGCVRLGPPGVEGVRYRLGRHSRLILFGLRLADSRPSPKPGSFFSPGFDEAQGLLVVSHG
jgi:hypothetical protein